MAITKFLFFEINIIKNNKQFTNYVNIINNFLILIKFNKMFQIIDKKNSLNLINKIWS